MPKQFENLTSLYEATLRDIYSNYEHYHAPRGNSEREVIGYSARLNNPRERFCRKSERRQNVVFNYAEALWYLSGKNDLEFIAWYAPSMQSYSPDGVSLPGTGYGARLKNFGCHNLDQVERAIDLLRHDDADSKRVVLQIFSADEDLYRRNIDVSCTLGLQLLMREGKLHMVGFMRANDAYVGMLNDIFSFTFLQEYIAIRLGCEIGHYTHQVGSIHIYDDTCTRALAMLKSSEKLSIAASTPSMPTDTTAETIRHVLACEAQIRQGEMSIEHINRLDLAAYWRDVLVLFFLFREIKTGHPLPSAALTAINPFFHPFLVNRWGAVPPSTPK